MTSLVLETCLCELTSIENRKFNFDETLALLSKICIVLQGRLIYNLLIQNYIVLKFIFETS